MNLTDKKSRFIGALLGTFVGDALGQPYEAWGVAIPPIEMARGRYTDDTQMMIGVAESLVACGGFNGKDMARRFVENFDGMRGYGSGAFQVIDRLAAGYSWSQAGAGLFGNGSFGNGSAMRAAPIGVLYHDNKEKLRETACLSSIISHAHPLGMQGAMVQAYAVALALQYGMSHELDEGQMIRELWDLLPVEPDLFHSKFAVINHLLTENPLREEVIEKLGNGIRSFESVPTAIYSFLSHPDKFEDAVVYAISLGGDTDTIGAMTGAIAGAYHGYQGIPSRWLDKLENGEKGRDYVISLANDLHDVFT